MIYLYLFKEFFKIGMLSFGGGYATLPFLYAIIEKYHWYSIEELKQMLAIASITPGPVGINMATYAGLKTHGIFAAILTTVSIILPSVFIVIIISEFLKKFDDNFYVKAAIYGLKTASCALIAAVGLRLLKTSITGSYDIIVLIILIFLFHKTKKKSTLFYLVASGLISLLLNFMTKV